MIEKRGEKLAVFVDKKGGQHLFSARCTHMGCTVGWNPAEHDVRLPVPRLALRPRWARS